MNLELHVLVDYSENPRVWKISASASGFDVAAIHWIKTHDLIMIWIERWIWLNWHLVWLLLKHKDLTWRQPTLLCRIKCKIFCHQTWLAGGITDCASLIQYLLGLRHILNLSLRQLRLQSLKLLWTVGSGGGVFEVWTYWDVGVHFAFDHIL